MRVTKRIANLFEDSFGYKHYWMLKVSDWLYNRYMTINKDLIKNNEIRQIENPTIKDITTTKYELRQSVN